MKLLYEFNFMSVGNEIVAVPIGKEAFNGIIKVSKDSKRLIEIIKESKNPDEVLYKVFEENPKDDKDVLAKQVCEFLNTLIKEGLLDPEQ